MMYLLNARCCVVAKLMANLKLQREEQKCLYLTFRETLVLCYNSTCHTFHKNRQLKSGVKILCTVILNLIFLTQSSPLPTPVSMNHLPVPKILPHGGDTLVKSMAGCGSQFWWSIFGSYLDNGTYLQTGNMWTSFQVLKLLVWQTQYF